MRAEEIMSHVRRKPFQPFRVFISDGASYDVRHPEMVLVTARTVVIAIEREDSQIPEESAWCDPVHVTRIELVNGGA
jgi:hypothetical protein